ncbi:MAG: hypothetical protein V4608_14935 [Bacteroidota bacterium]
MTEKLLTMKIGETKEFDRGDHRSILSIKTELKRKGKGNWQSELSSHGLFIKRTA